MTNTPFMTKELNYLLHHDELEFRSNIRIHDELINKVVIGLTYKKNSEVEELLKEYIELNHYSYSDTVKCIEHIVKHNGVEKFVDISKDNAMIVEVSAPKYIWREDKDKFQVFLDAKLYVTKGF